MMAEVGATQENSFNRANLANDLRQISKSRLSFEDEDAIHVKDQIRKQVNEKVQQAGLPSWRTHEYNIALDSVRRKIGVWRAQAQAEKTIGRGRWQLDNDLYCAVDPQASLKRDLVREVVSDGNEDERPDNKPDRKRNSIVRDQAAGSVGAGLTVMPPWMRRDYASDAAWDSLDDAGPSDYMCWLQPILMDARLTMAPKSETYRPNWSRWSLSLSVDDCSSDKPQRFESQATSGAETLTSLARMAIGSKDRDFELQLTNACNDLSKQRTVRRSLANSPSRGADSD